MPAHGTVDVIRCDKIDGAQKASVASTGTEVAEEDFRGPRAGNIPSWGDCLRLQGVPSKP